MKFSAVLSASILSVSALAAPATLAAREAVEIDFAACVTKGLTAMRQAHPDAELLWAEGSSDHFAAVQGTRGLNVMKLTFDSQSAGGTLVIQTKQHSMKEFLHEGDSMGCVFGPERLVPGHTTGAAPISWPGDVSITIDQANDIFGKEKSWNPFISVRLAKQFGASQASYIFNTVDKKIKIGAKDGKATAA